MFGHQRVELLHPARTPFADALSTDRAARARVIPVYPTTARGTGAQGHSPATGRAHRQPRQQDRARDYTWRRGFWIAGFQPTLNLLKDVGFDDGRDGNFDNFVLRF